MKRFVSPLLACLAPVLGFQCEPVLCLPQHPTATNEVHDSADSPSLHAARPVAIAGKPCSHTGFSGLTDSVFTTTPCGSEPARDSAGSACIHPECAAAIAGKPCSHTDFPGLTHSVFTPIPQIGRAHV